MKKQEQICGIVFDAISIKSGIFYDVANDKMQGYEDLGEYASSKKIAQYAMVFMAKGLASNWKQTLGFFYFHKSVKSEILCKMISDCFTKLKDSGFIPKFVICHQDTTNRSVFNKFCITSYSPSLLHNGDDIYFFFDTPHLLKSIRNNLMKYDFKVDNKIISWKYVVDFYKRDSSMYLRFAPKLHDQHVFLTTRQNEGLSGFSDI